MLRQQIKVKNVVKNVETSDQMNKTDINKSIRINEETKLYQENTLRDD